jgi:hypothetical protein
VKEFAGSNGAWPEGKVIASEDRFVASLLAMTAKSSVAYPRRRAA